MFYPVSILLISEECCVFLYSVQYFLITHLVNLFYTLHSYPYPYLWKPRSRFHIRTTEHTTHSTSPVYSSSVYRCYQTGNKNALTCQCASRQQTKYKTTRKNYNVRIEIYIRYDSTTIFPCTRKLWRKQEWQKLFNKRMHARAHLSSSHDSYFLRLIQHTFVLHTCILLQVSFKKHHPVDYSSVRYV